MKLSRQCPVCERVEPIDSAQLKRGKLPKMRCYLCNPVPQPEGSNPPAAAGTTGEHDDAGAESNAGRSARTHE